MKTFIILTIALIAFSFTDASAQDRRGFIHMDQDVEKKQEQPVNTYINVADQRDTIKLYDMHGKFVKDTIVTNVTELKHGLWHETDENGNKQKVIYDRGKVVSTSPE